MKVPEADRHANGETANAEGGGKFMHGFSEGPEAEDVLVILCGRKGAGGLHQNYN